MSFDFPSSGLTVGQQFTPVAGTTYQWNGYAWDLVTSSTVLASGAVQQVYAENTATNLSTSTYIAGGFNTVPQQTDGVQILSATITPKTVGNMLRIDVVAIVSSSGMSSSWVGLFQDSAASALASVVGNPASAGAFFPLVSTFELLVTSLLPTTLKVRMGPSQSGNTTYLNSSSGTAFLGGNLRATLTVTEYSPLISPSPTFTGGNVLLATRTASNQATIDFISLMDSTYDEYEVHFFDVLCATNADALATRIGQSGVIQTGATAYKYNLLNTVDTPTTSVNGSTGTNMIALVALSNQSNLAGRVVNGWLRIARPASSTLKSLTFQSAYYGVSNWLTSAGSGAYLIDTNPIDSLRFLMVSGGNISTGTFKLYGVR